MEKKVFMTEQEKDKQFSDFGCTSRCIMKLANISKEDFCKQFEKYFPGDKYGGLTVNSLIQIIQDLKLCSRLEVSDSIGDTKTNFNGKKTKGIFLVTEYARDGAGKLSVFYHCRLLINWINDTLILWHPNPDGKEFEVHVSEIGLGEQMPHFVVLY